MDPRGAPQRTANTRVLFAGGGTGGHLYPAIALAGALRESEVLFVGTADRLEADIVPAAGYELQTIAATPGKVNLSGVFGALRILRDFRPDIVIATGGYVSVPTVIAAKLLRIVARWPKIALLELNAHPGKANRALAPLVDEIWGAFPANERSDRKYVYTGIPVRSSILHPDNRIAAARRLGLDPSRRTILAIGGSQGARSINEAVAGLATRRALPATWQLLHLCGERDFEYMQAEERKPFGDNKIVLMPYLQNMADAYAVSDLAIARAGASTIGELVALGLPSILVPYPFATEAHQNANAQALASRGACLVIEDRALSADSLWWSLRDLMEPQRLAKMRSAVQSLRAGDPVAVILSRVDALLSRTG